MPEYRRFSMFIPCMQGKGIDLSYYPIGNLKYFLTLFQLLDLFVDLGFEPFAIRTVYFLQVLQGYLVVFKKKTW